MQAADWNLRVSPQLILCTLFACKPLFNTKTGQLFKRMLNFAMLCTCLSFLFPRKKLWRHMAEAELEMGKDE